MAGGFAISTKLQIGEVRGRHEKGGSAREMKIRMSTSCLRLLYCFLCQYQ